MAQQDTNLHVFFWLLLSGMSTAKPKGHMSLSSLMQSIMHVLIVATRSFSYVKSYGFESQCWLYTCSVHSGLETSFRHLFPKT